MVSADAPLAHTAHGAVRGVARPGSSAFLGIPYAADPVGPLRFLPPFAPPAWEGVRDATAYGPTAQRMDMIGDLGDIPRIPEPSIPGDGILAVNVFTPAPGDTGAGLPVLFWVHGGGFVGGSPASPWYDGRSFNRDGVVMVTVGYRLGFDGFGWVEGGGLNRGLLDIVAALEWTRDNIRAFGGDPGRVTIGGQSAGGNVVQALLSTPRARGLFRGAIMQSARVSSIGPEPVIEASRRFAAALGIPPTLEGWRTVDELAIIERQAEFNVMDGPRPAPHALNGLRGVVHDTQEPGRKVLYPVVDGELVTRRSREAFASPELAEVPILYGMARNELIFPSDRPADEVVAELRAAGFTDAELAPALAEIALIAPEYASGQADSFGRFRGSAYLVGLLRNQAGAGERTWLYDFAGRNRDSRLSFHSLDIPFVFDLLDAEGVAEALGAGPSQALADAMHADWVRFVTTGSLPWPTADAAPTGARRYDASGATDAPDAFLLEEAAFRRLA